MGRALASRFFLEYHRHWGTETPSKKPVFFHTECKEKDYVELMELPNCNFSSTLSLILGDASVSQLGGVRKNSVITQPFLQEIF